MSRISVWRCLLLTLMISVGLMACQSGQEQVGPPLVAPATRTAPPLTPTPEASQAPVVAYRVISMAAPVRELLIAAEEVSALERIDLLSQYLINPQPACYDFNWLAGVQPLQLLDPNIVSLDLARWQAAADIFPEAELLAALGAGIEAVGAVVPHPGEFTVCVYPWPLFGDPEEQDQGGLFSVLVADDTLLMFCRAGEFCLETLAREATLQYVYGVQVAQAGLPAVETPLLNILVYQGRAAAVARQLDPAVQFPWDDALSAEEEAALWTSLADDLAVTGPVEYRLRDVLRALLGPDGIGLAYLGDQLVQSFQQQNPQIDLATLLALPPADVLAASGYDPAPPAAE